MNSTDHPFDHDGAHDALLDLQFDRLERELLALTTAPLDMRERIQHQCVDEFANEFLGHFSLPPRRRCRNAW